MNRFCLIFRHLWPVVFAVALVLTHPALAGGGRPPATADAPLTEIPPPRNAGLRTGDILVVGLRGIPQPQELQSTVNDQGDLTGLPFIGNVRAAGITESMLAAEIQRLYIEGRYYRAIDISVSVLQRFLTVGGRVNRPGPIIWTPDMTALKAIQAAGDFALYSSQNRVLLIRDGVAYTLDIQAIRRGRRPDVRLFPGDTIDVPRSNI